MNIGAHVSIAGGVFNAPLNAAKIGCECFQIFTRSPQGGPAPVLSADIVAQFKKNCTDHNLTNFYIHTPYYINLASATDRIRHGSIQIIRDELERGSLLGAKALMTHLGSAKDVGEKEALRQVIAGVREALDGYRGSTQFLMEISAGSGKVIGDTFEEIGAILQGVPNQVRDKLAVCFDTCHAFVSGYDLRTPAAVEKTLASFDTAIGLEKLILIHANDAKKELGSHTDRHEHIGLGTIGQNGFRALLHHRALQTVDFILETPPDKNADDIKLLKKLRG